MEETRQYPSLEGRRIDANQNWEKCQMRGLLILLMVVFGGPAFSQQLNCRGLAPLEFDDGGKGCLHSIKPGKFTFTRTMEGVQFSQVEWKAMYINAIMQEGYSSRSAVQRQRLLTLCKRYLGEVQKQAKGEKFERIIVRLFWPGVARSKSKQKASGSDFVAQKGYTNASCRNFGYLD